jgi:hypothetical protein
MLHYEKLMLREMSFMNQALLLLLDDVAVAASL